MMKTNGSNNHKACPLYRYCLTQKHENDTCDYMLRKYNAGLLLPPEYKEEENEQSRGVERISSVSLIDEGLFADMEDLIDCNYDEESEVDTE